MIDIFLCCLSQIRVVKCFSDSTHSIFCGFSFNFYSARNQNLRHFDKVRAQKKIVLLLFFHFVDITEHKYIHYQINV